MKKRISNIIIGIILLALGILLVGNIAGLWKVDLFFDGWWTILIMIISLLSIIFDKANIFNVYFLLFGGTMLLRYCGVISKDVSGWLIALALLIVALGVKIIISAVFKSSDPLVGSGYNESNAGAGGNYKSEIAFSEQTLNFNGLEFTSANYEVVFGKLTLDLRGATLTDNAFLSIECVFGGVNVIVPSDVKVNVSREAVFGAVKNNTSASGEKVINIKAEAVFGSVEINKV